MYILTDLSEVYFTLATYEQFSVDIMREKSNYMFKNTKF